jgi:sugar phosphate isomerase/epimerase
MKQFAVERVPNPSELDYIVVSEAIMLSNTSTETLRQIAKHVTGVHGKFNYMSEIAGRPGQYQDIAIDYDGAIAALKNGGFDGYINSEYEGQRYFQDRTRADMMSEVDQVRRHHEMLRRLLAA